MGLAGPWEARKEGDAFHYSFSMLTVNADTHLLMKHMHELGEEKRMVVVLDPDDYGEWMHATPENAFQWLRQYPAEQLTAEPAPGERSRSLDQF